MNTDLARLIKALRRALNDAVAPELNSDHARGQLAAVHDILGKLAGMVVWDPQALKAQTQALAEGNQAFAARAAQAGLALPACGSGTDLAGAETRTRQLTDWLDRQEAVLPAPLAAELDAILRQTLREQLRIERKRIPLTDFSAMTSGAANDTKD
ncbi:MAG: hypothetical protein A2710_23555 [Burkholderiales bacterium RIFCSPHIGHO2_01_FULL_64_960]|nr:MAG: hypothetical protein A2710_23555 [Burkholderiales bacterium RIFCSPHIGHO2_01_FULL_64_960]